MNKTKPPLFALFVGLMAACATQAPVAELPASSLSVAHTKPGQVSVVSPEYCSDIKGNTTITISAPGFNTLAVKCWKQGPGFGSDSTVVSVVLDAEGRGSFVFPAESYPHGPSL